MLAPCPPGLGGLCTRDPKLMMWAALQIRVGDQEAGPWALEAGTSAHSRAATAPTLTPSSGSPHQLHPPFTPFLGKA